MSSSFISILKLAVLGFLCVHTAAHAQLVVGWNFNNQSLTPEHGTGTLITDGLGTSAFLPVGSSQNLTPGDEAGDALVFAVTNLNNGGSLLLQMSTVGREAPVLSYAIGSTTEGFDSIQWAWSTDGTNYTAFSGPLAVPGFVDTTQVTQMQVHTLDFTSVGGLALQPAVYLRGTLDGATASLSAANLIMDNIRVTAAAVPEPASVAAWLGGATLLGVVARRFRRRSTGVAATGAMVLSMMISSPEVMAAAESEAPALAIEAVHRVTQRGGSLFQLEHALINKGSKPARFDLAIVPVGDAGKMLGDLRLLVRGADGEWRPLSELSHTTEELAPGGRLEFAIAGTTPGGRRSRVAAELRIEASVAGRPVTLVTVSNRLTILPVSVQSVATARMPLDVTVVSSSD